MPPDYSGQNLRGRSFKRQNLEGANFSYADIRSADFSSANLRGANFSHAKAGLQRRWAVFLLCISYVVHGTSGFFLNLFIFLPTIIAYNLPPDIYAIGWAALALIVVIVLFVVIFRQRLNSVLVVALALALGIPTAFFFIYILVLAGALVGLLVLAVAGAVTLNVALAVAGVLAYAVLLVGGVALAGTYAHSITTLPLPQGQEGIGTAEAYEVVLGLAVALAAIFFIACIAWRALKGDPKYALIRNMTIVFAAFKGTSFCNTDLTDANFTGATLKNTDFRKAILTRTHFYKAQKFNSVRPGSTYLQKAQVPEVLVTGQGQDKIFDRQDLRGVNFKGANLVDASFIGANLSEANLQDANLSRAKLVQTQLDGTDFTGAILTGAYIKDWGITSDTNFDGVRCEYVYMQLPTKENPDPLRKPDNNKEVFADGEFGDFIKPIFDTLDLYHNQGVDPRAIAISFKHLAENYPEAELRIVGMEVKGEDKFLIRAKTSPSADKSELSAEYFSIYNELKALAEQDLKALISQKDSQIRRLENMIMTALERPSFYAQTYHNQGNTMSDNSDNSTYNLNHAKFGGGFAGTQGTQSGGTFNENLNNKNQGEKELSYSEPQTIQSQPKSPASNHLVCTNCSYKNPKYSKFCSKCGSQIASLT
jgi:uncharacterized protein YjbI with pentapeptide repeats